MPPMKNGVRLTDKKSIAKIEDAISKLGQTKDIWWDENASDYLPERKKLHNAIVNKIRASAFCIERDRPIAILMGGVAGSGKSTILKKYAPWMTSDKILKIDADEIRTNLPEYKGWNSTATHMEVKDIVSRVLGEIGQPCTFDVIYDGTMTNYGKYFSLIRELKSLGYLVFLLFVKVSPETSLKRVMSRYANPENEGRYVPMNTLKEMWEDGDKAFNQLKEVSDGYVLFDGENQNVLDTGGEAIPTERYYIGKDVDADEAKPQLKEDKIKMVEALIRLVDRMKNQTEVTISYSSLLNRMLKSLKKS
jgi:predicted ABC-type ATPase